jgi:hypothetical protein
VQPRQLNASDLNPVSVALTVEDRFSRSWSRAVKYYDSLRFVYEIQGQIREWREQSGQTQEPAQPAKDKDQGPSRDQNDAQTNRPKQSTPSETSK